MIQTSGFWGWVTGPHPTIRRAVLLIVSLAVLYLVVTYIHWVVAVLFIVALVLAFFMFRGMWFEGDGVRAILFHKDDPNTVDLLHMGTDAFEALEKTGGKFPMQNSYGQPVYVIEDMNDGVARFAWIHDLSRIQFISKSMNYDVAVKLSERSQLALYRIKDLVRALGMNYAGKIINVYERDISRNILTLDPTNKEYRDILDELEKMEDPLKEVRKEVEDIYKVHLEEEDDQTKG